MAKCLICEKELVLDHGNPMGGTIWRCSGNYGSAIYDNFDRPRTYLVAYLCDGCLLTARSKMVERTTTCENTYTDQEPNF